MRLPLLLILSFLTSCTPAHRLEGTDAGGEDIRPTVCGDSYVNAGAGEQCDDGNTASGDGCDSDCHIEVAELCGNDAFDAETEQCDDGNNEAGDGCGPGCWIEGCGNSFLDPGEACEDSNTVGGDGCSADCKSDESCGNSIEDPGEDCDDGNEDETDTCPSSCKTPYCGDGFVRTGVENCDDGNDVADDGCTECILDSCGNGIEDPGEECDLGAANGLAGATCFRNCILTEVNPAVATTTLLAPLGRISAEPLSLTSADFNGDSRADLLVTDRTNARISLLYGFGDGRLWAPVQNFDSETTRAFALADVNGDEILDALSVTYPGSHLRVRLGNGTTFGPIVSYDTGSGNSDYSFDLAIAELTGDEFLDVVVAQYNANTLTILAGDGAGAFTLVSTLATQVGDAGSRPRAVAVGDVTGDGVVDIVSVNNSSDDLSLFPGLGEGVYGAGQIFTTRIGAGGDGPVDVVVTDVTNDNIADVIVASSSSSDVVVLAASNGSLAPPQRFTTSGPGDTGNNPRQVVVADVTQDGEKDIIVTNSTNDITVLAGLGPGVAFGPAIIYSLEIEGLAAASPVGLAVRDLDGDAIPDIIVADGSRRGVTILRGSSDGELAAPRSFSSQSSEDTGNTQRVEVADINDDGKMDVVVMTNRTVAVLAGLGDGLVANSQISQYLSGAQSAVGHFNDDSLLDYVTPYQSFVARMIQNPAGLFEVETSSVTGNAAHLAVGEFSGSAFDDVAVAGNSALVTQLNNEGVLTIGGIMSSSTPRDCELADVNGDNELDIILVSSQTDSVTVNIGTGTGDFAAPMTISTEDGTSGQQPWQVTTGDLNGDGVTDMVTANYRSNDLTVLLGSGGGAFEAPRIVPTVFGADNAYVTSVVIGDFNDDNRPDLAAANSARNTVSVVLGLGDGLFAAPQTYEVPAEPTGLAVADFNGDGVDDLAVSSFAGGSVTTLVGFSHP